MSETEKIPIPDCTDCNGCDSGCGGGCCGSQENDADHSQAACGDCASHKVMGS